MEQTSIVVEAGWEESKPEVHGLKLFYLGPTPASFTFVSSNFAQKKLLGFVVPHRKNLVFSLIGISKESCHLP